MDQTFMKERAVLPLVLSMSLPMMLSMVVLSLYNIVDSYFVAKISEEAMTALSLVFPIQNLIGAITIGFGVGINAAVAFHLGAGEFDRADAAATQGVVLSALHGVVLTVVCIAAMPSFLGMFTSDAEVVSLGLRYSNIAFGFSVVIALSLAYEKLFQSVGRMAATMACMMAGCVANIVLDPIMIFGLGPVPAMGIEGAAWATGIGQTLTLALYLLLNRLRPMAVHVEARYARLTRGTARRLYSVGVPAALNLALPSLLISSLNIILAGYSQVYVVVLGVYYKLQTFLYLPANGIVQGMRPLVGYNFGAREYGRVRRICMTALALAAGIMAAGTLLCQTVPEALIGPFTSNAETVRAGAEALHIISLGFVVSTVSVIASGALEGLGMGAPSFVISLLRYAVITIPAAFVLSRFFGAAGVWHAFWFAELCTAAASYFIYRSKTSARTEARGAE
ncbi:MATE family efflux transporter [Cloacibacillus sp. An23]|uniref:MATE family efflux transporter n=1 Tax=Cloacibacillus sp. An23 TaxID=1965591 RepID=UPI000B376CF8|nr:MATE family efflux transporter [Cloacibacillus sp. An23]OUO93339.1 MATE family efflux transporter [Cloacibacillus sp. An23]